MERGRLEEIKKGRRARSASSMIRIAIINLEMKWRPIAKRQRKADSSQIQFSIGNINFQNFPNTIKSNFKNNPLSKKIDFFFLFSKLIMFAEIIHGGIFCLVKED